MTFIITSCHVLFKCVHALNVSTTQLLMKHQKLCLLFIRNCQCPQMLMYLPRQPSPVLQSYYSFFGRVLFTCHYFGAWFTFNLFITPCCQLRLRPCLSISTHPFVSSAKALDPQIHKLVIFRRNSQAASLLNKPRKNEELVPISPSEQEYTKSRLQTTGKSPQKPCRVPITLP